MNKTINAFVVGAMITATSPVVLATDNVFGGIGYSYYDGRDIMSEVSSNAFRIGFGTELNKNVGISLNSEFNQNSDIEFDQANSIEGTLFGKYQIPRATSFSLIGNGTIGQKWVNSFDSFDFSYYSVTGGIGYDFGQGTIGVSYKYQNAFDNEVYSYETNSGILSGEYMITKNHGIGGEYEYSGGDLKFNKYSINYKFVF